MEVEEKLPPEKQEVKGELLYTLSKKSVYFLFFYYAILIIGGLIVLSTGLLHFWTDTGIEIRMIITVESSCLLFSGLKYTRKLYKACIDNKIIRPEGVVSLCKLGNVVYFVMRPIYSCAFSVLVLYLNLSGIVRIGPGGVDEKSLYIYVLIAACIGYQSGTVIDLFDKISKEKITYIAGKGKKNG